MFTQPISIVTILIFIIAMAVSPNSLSAENTPLMALQNEEAFKCSPTPPDAKGPFYKPGAPLRDSVGSGYVLKGSVMSAHDCSPIKGAQIEIWMAGPDGEYSDAYRAILLSDNLGNYRFESHFPPAYFGRPPHHHLRVAVPGFKTLITQHYPQSESQGGVFDLVLIPK